MNCTRSDIWARRTLEVLRMFRSLSLLPDPKDKIEQQNLLHTATMAAEEGETEKARAALEKVLQLDDESSALAL